MVIFLSALEIKFLLIPAFILQYMLALFCLYKLVMIKYSNRRFNNKKFWLWNVFILLVFFVGSITFLVCSSPKFKDKFFPITDEEYGKRLESNQQNIENSNDKIITEENSTNINKEELTQEQQEIQDLKKRLEQLEKNNKK